jgi:hypothetical protein
VRGGLSWAIFDGASRYSRGVTRRWPVISDNGATTWGPITDAVAQLVNAPGGRRALSCVDFVRGHGLGPMDTPETTRFRVISCNSSNLIRQSLLVSETEPGAGRGSHPRWDRDPPSGETEISE